MAPLTTRLQIAIVIVATLACLVPCVTKAFTIDDPLFLWVGQHIRNHPADPYGFTVNWDYTDRKISDVTKNPPLNSYYLALGAYLFGWSEIALHAIFLIPALAVILGTYLLARRFCENPMLAALATLVTPAFLVSSSTVMCDTMMLALWVWAVFLWVCGIDDGNHIALTAAAILTALAALTKYYGVALIPLLGLYTLVKKRALGIWCAYFLIPVAVLGWYQWITQAVYGRGLLLDAGAYAASWRSSGNAQVLSTSLVGLVFTGGCLITTFFYAPFIWRRVHVAWGLAGAAVIALLAVQMKMFGHFPVSGENGLKGVFVAYFAALAVSGIAILAMAIQGLVKSRDAGSTLLFCWVIGTFVFATFLNWVVNGRSILPMAPAVGIILMRAIERKRGAGGAGGGWRIFLPLIPAAIIGIIVLWSDCSQANTARRVAREIVMKHPPEGRTGWFQGHWGFQYYMKKQGYRSFDAAAFTARPGDILIVPETNDCPFPPPYAIALKLIDTIEIPPGLSVKTMDRYIGAGFYAHEWGPLPFAAGAAPHERYLVFAVTGEDVPQPSSDDPEKTIITATEYLHDRPYSSAVYSALGTAYVKKGDYAKAIFAYTEDISLFPHSAKTYNNRGYAYAQLGEDARAITDYQQALRMHKGYSKALKNLRDIYAREKEARR